MDIKVGNKKIGEKRPVFIIAEISANHGQNLNMAVAMIKKAKECGVDAVKFQTYTPDTMTIDVDRKQFKVEHSVWGGETLYSLYRKAYTPWNWFKKLKKTADDLGLIFFSTAFDKTSIDMLEDLKVPLHKISSFELVDIPLIKYAAGTGKPLIMSTGMASSEEIKEAVDVARKAGVKDIVLLKCVSSYPADPVDFNLRTISDMKERYNVISGLSDHSLGISVPIASVAMGAKVIEKHFTLSRSKDTPDNFFSLEPEEMRELVFNIRNVEKSIGKVSYGCSGKEVNSRKYRRSLFIVKDVKKGEIFTEENIRSIRPAQGLKPKYWWEILGRKAAEDIKRGTPLRIDLIN